jgi:hypothetical protein
MRVPKGNAKKMAVFQAIAYVSFFVALFTPKIFLFFPTMIVLITAVISLLRRERRWGLSLIALFLGGYLILAPTFDQVGPRFDLDSERLETRRNEEDLRAEILYVEYVWSTETTHDKVADVSGEVRNNIDRPIEVVLNIVARNSQDRIVDSRQVYVPLAGQIPPKSTGAIKTHFYDDGRGITKIEASIAKVYVK